MLETFCVAWFLEPLQKSENAIFEKCKKKYFRVNFSTNEMKFYFKYLCTLDSAEYGL